MPRSKGFLESTGLVLGPTLLALGVILLLRVGFVVELSRAAVDAPELAADREGAQGLDDRLVSLTGAIQGVVPLADEPRLGSGGYVALRRSVEAFAWKQRSEMRGGVLHYTYSQDWVDQPELPGSFAEPAGHVNLPKSLPTQELRGPSAKIGVHRIEMAGLIFPAQEISVPDATPGKNGVTYVFQGKGSLDHPQIGDLRIHYAALKNGTQVTLLGRVTPNGSISPYRHVNGEVLYRLFEGDHARFVSGYRLEPPVMEWILRGIGFVLILLGMGALAWVWRLHLSPR